MPIVSITAADDPRLDAYRHIDEPELVRRKGFTAAAGRSSSVGAEGSGLSAGALECADARVRIPMWRASIR